MGIFEKLKLSERTAPHIEWEITPDLAFCTFSAKGLRGDLSKSGERICYFFVDNWGDRPRLYLMERGSRYVNILAEVKAPPELLAACILGQGAYLDGIIQAACFHQFYVNHVCGAHADDGFHIAG